jgi:hypothetical protein
MDGLRHMATTPCGISQFRQYISKVFADQLQGTVNDVRGDKITARPKVLEDLPAWPSVLQKFEGKAIGFDLSASRGTAWGRTRQSLNKSVTRPADPGNLSIQLVNGLNLFILDKWLRLLIRRVPFEPLHLGKMYRTYEHCT